MDAMKTDLIKASFVGVLSRLSDDELRELSVDAYIAAREEMLVAA